MAKVEVADELFARVAAEAGRMGMSAADRIAYVLGRSVAPPENLDPEFTAKGLSALKEQLERVPAVQWVSVSGSTEAYWWAKFGINLAHPLAWRVVQELAFVFNYLSVEERLPTIFRPVSPPPYLNGGPREFLAWIIEARIPFLDAGNIARIMVHRLPPLDDSSQWELGSEEDAEPGAAADGGGM